MSMKGRGLLMSMLAFGLMGGGSPNLTGEFMEKETPEQKKLRENRIKSKISEKHGLKKFVYGENILWALNQKSADKKAKKLNYI